MSCGPTHPDDSVAAYARLERRLRCRWRRWLHRFLTAFRQIRQVGR